MTFRTLILRSLQFHARSHVGVVLGAAVSVAVLAGALIVGDSVRGSLRDLAMQRIGGIEVALQSGDRLFQAPLAQSLANRLSADVAPLLHVPGNARSADGTARANQVVVLGVTDPFWDLAPVRPHSLDIPDGTVLLNRPLAEQLKRPEATNAVQPGDTVLLRVSKPSALSRDAPLAPEEDASTALRLKVHRILSDDEFGRFSLFASQTAPFTAFVNLSYLQQQLGLGNQANMMVGARREEEAGGKTSIPGALTPEDCEVAMQQCWSLADAQLELRAIPSSAMVDLRTPRVFLDPAVSEPALKAEPNALGVLTYLVNGIQAGERTTPYSMVTATTAPPVPADLNADEIIINQWLAEDLQTGIGQEIALTYYVVGFGRELLEESARFQVRSILPMDATTADASFMPDFPGLTDAENCADWDAGFPIDTGAIRPKDEAYWDEYRGAPKAFISLAAGQKLWGNRFGTLTAVRYPVDASALLPTGTKRSVTDPILPKSVAELQPLVQLVEHQLLQSIDPARVGLRFESVRNQALTAASQSQDFGGLFIGFSFFLIVAALMLISLLFQFGLEQRTTEVGTLLALGLTPRRVRLLFWGEGTSLALIGGGLGLIGGILYAKGMLRGLNTIWRDAVGTSALTYHAQFITLALGLGLGVVVVSVTLWFALRHAAKRPVRALLTGAAPDDLSAADRPDRRYLITSLIAGGTALLLVLIALLSGNTQSGGTFFAAGSLSLVAFLAGCRYGFGQLTRQRWLNDLSLLTLAIRATTRRQRRSLATIGLLACGSFLIASIGVFRLDANLKATERASGTGGFALVGESSLPVIRDLNDTETIEAYALDPDKLMNTAVVAFRVRDGDEASCLNLNRAQNPQLLGVNSRQLAQRHAFAFAKIADGFDSADPWMLLTTPVPKTLVTTAPEENNIPAIPAIGDLNSILWAMGKKVGDRIRYQDEKGRFFDVVLVGAVANSILQGNLIIDERVFVQLFPSEPGYRFFLIDAPTDQAAGVAAEFSRGLEDLGMELTPTARRLNAFNAVQNTYLGTFQLLGGLGLLLGSVGLGIVVLRNVLERRSELALLLAVGFRRRDLYRLVVAEHGALLVAGLSVGIIAAFIAVAPSLLSPTQAFPWRTLFLTLSAILLNGLVWTVLATLLALRGALLSALRNE